MALLPAISGCFFAAAADYYRRLQASIDALPSVKVHIVNKTGVPALVTFDSAIAPPQGGIYGGLVPPEMGLISAENKSVLVAAGGTVDGTIKYGEVIAVSAVTPGDADAGYYYGSYEEAFEFYTYSGNIRFGGAGASSEGSSGFTGDVLNAGLARFIRPAVDGLDSSGTLGVEITTAGTLGSRDSTSGSYTGGTTGAGTVSIQ